MKKVVITGVGMINAVGNSAKESFENILKGMSGVDIISHFDASTDRVKIAAEVKAFDPSDILNAKEIKKCDRFVHLGLYAAKEALNDAQMDIGMLDNTRIGVSGATGIGGLPSIQQIQRKIMNIKRFHLFLSLVLSPIS